jgi:hypothetical protein
MQVASAFSLFQKHTLVRNFPVLFPVTREYEAETGSLVTGPSAIQSAAQRIVL